MRKYLCNLRTYYVNFRATSLKYCYLHVLNFYLDNGVMTTPKRRFLSFAFTVLSFKKSLLIRNIWIYKKIYIYIHGQFRKSISLSKRNVLISFLKISTEAACLM